MQAEIIEIDASGWRKVLDFYNAVLKRLGAPPGHGKSIDALVDSIVWGGVNRVEAPYVLRLCNTGALPCDVMEEIKLGRVDGIPDMFF